MRADRSIRDLGEADLDWLAEKEAEIFGAAAWSPAQIDQDFHSGLRRYRGIEESGVLLGYSVCGFDGDSFHLLNLAVVPGARRRGCARKLVDDFLDEARRLGVREVSLEVAVTNAAAIALYRGYGFAVVRTRPRYYQPEDVDGLVMGLALVGH
ncbi:MAG: GNAT family N-acetyltransferase [Demequinaceae bacterium]|nr:GNAT family N-acetyltransferase [Demequinaceae bacterium]